MNSFFSHDGTNRIYHGRNTFEHIWFSKSYHDNACAISASTENDQRCQISPIYTHINSFTAGDEHTYHIMLISSLMCKNFNLHYLSCQLTNFEDQYISGIGEASPFILHHFQWLVGTNEHFNFLMICINMLISSCDQNFYSVLAKICVHATIFRFVMN
jgi:hypothetical protein